MSPENSWHRSHDRLIAERIEDFVVVEYRGDYYRAYTQPLAPVPDYLTDIAACFRAADRAVRIDSTLTYSVHGDGQRKSVAIWRTEDLHIDSFEAQTPSEAFARALHQLAERIPCANDSK